MPKTFFWPKTYIFVLILGIGDEEFFIASDATPLAEHTKNVVYLNDEEIAVVNRGSELQIKNIGNEIQTPYIQELDMQIEEMEKGYTLNGKVVRPARVIVSKAPSEGE